MYISGFSSQSTDSQLELSWDASTVSLILAAPTFASILGSLLVDAIRGLVGSKRCVLIIFSTSAVLNLLCPATARVSPYFFMVVIIVVGLSRTTGQVIMGEVIAWWFPAAERMFASSFSIAGLNTAVIIGSFYSGYACSIPVDNGWPFLFYIIFGVMVIYLILWWVLSTTQPDSHPFISKKELQFIVTNRSGMDEGRGKKSATPPYRQMLRSKALYGYLILSACYMWVMSSTMSYLAILYKTTLKFSTSETGLMISLIAVVRIVCGFGWVGFSRVLVSTNCFSMNHVRKITVMTGLGTAAVLHFIIAGIISFANPWVIFSLHLCIHAFDCVVQNLFGVLPLDMAPRYASTINAIQGTFATTISITGPLFTGFMTQDYSKDQWRFVFIIWGAVVIGGGMFFCLLGEAVLQPWAEELSDTVVVNKSTGQTDMQINRQTDKQSDRQTDKHISHPESGSDCVHDCKFQAESEIQADSKLSGVSNVAFCDKESVRDNSVANIEENGEKGSINKA